MAFLTTAKRWLWTKTTPPKNGPQKWSRGVQTPFFRGKIFALIKNCVSLICLWERHKKTGPTKKRQKIEAKKRRLWCWRRTGIFTYSGVKPHFESPRSSTHTTNEKKNETRRGRVGGETKIAREDKGSGGIWRREKRCSTDDDDDASNVVYRRFDDVFFSLSSSASLFHVGIHAPATDDVRLWTRTEELL